MDYPSAYKRKYYVCFYEGKAWTRYITGKKWGHVQVFTPSLGGCIEIGYRGKVTQLTEHPFEFWEHMATIEERPHTIIGVDVCIHKSDVLMFGILTCVGLAKSLLNLKGFIFTPKQLYDKLCLTNEVWKE